MESFTLNYEELDFLFLKKKIKARCSELLPETQELDPGGNFLSIKIETLFNIFVQLFFAHGNGISYFGN